MTLRFAPLLLAAALLAACSAGVPHGAAVAQPAAGLEALGASKGQPLRAKGVAGDVRVHRDVASKHLPRKRDVFVYVPPGYDQAAGQRYPVLYMHDGNNLFDPATAFMGNEWQIDESMEQLLKQKKIPPMIVVGVSNTPDRMGEYTWVAGDLDGKRAGGDGAKYGQFLVEELKPMIDKAYRTKPGRTDTGVMGSSLGGLQSLYLGRHHGATFGKIGAMSPSVWWADRAVLQEPAKFPTDLRVWLDFGHREGSDPAAGLKNARDLDRGLEARGYTEGKDLRFWEDREGGHDERAWAYRFPLAMIWLFGA